MIFNYTLEIKAERKENADKRITDLKALEANLSEKELAKLAHIVLNDKATFNMAKMFLGV